MLIHEMTLEECRDTFTQTNLARLACEMNGEPYVVPVYLSYDENYLFGFSSMGFKIDCMRANPLVCVEIDDVKTQNEWMSVLVFGTYEELPDTPENVAARARAYELLEKRAMWWEPASVAVEHREYPKTVSPIFYRILIDRMTGHRASPDRLGVPAAPTVKDRGWLHRLLDRMARSQMSSSDAAFHNPLQNKTVFAVRSPEIGSGAMSMRH